MKPFQIFLEYLPKSEGWLPMWQLFIAFLAVFNSVQNYVTIYLTRQVYNGVADTITPLQARTFAAWTLTAAVVRAYAAYNINNKAVYDITLLTYLIAYCHFISEILIFRTAKIGRGVAGPVIVSITTLIWMVKQYDFYLKSSK